MRLVSLDLSGYGRLPARSIEGFAPYTVVHGPNEAGKSTLRRLLRDMLFGFPVTTARSHPYAFSKTMEARGRMALSDGRNLTLHRKRSANDFLRIEPADFGNDAWKALLSGMDDALYGRMLCCSAQEMTSGTAQALREGRFLETLRGDAAGGLRTAKDLLADAEAALSRFRTGQGHRRHRGELDRAKAELAGISTGWDELASKSSSLRDLEEGIATLQDRLASLGAEILLRERSAHLAKVAENAASLEEELLRQGSPVVLPPRARERSDDLSSERTRLRADLHGLEAERREALDELAQIPPHDPILEADHGILEPLQGRRDGIAALLRELPALRDRTRGARAQLESVTSGLFPDTSSLAPGSTQPSLFDSSPLQGRIPESASETTQSELARLRAAWIETETEAAQCRRELAHLDQTLRGLTPPDELDPRERDLANLWRGQSRSVEAARAALDAATLRGRTAERALAKLDGKLCLAGLPPRDELFRAKLPSSNEAHAAAAEWRASSAHLDEQVRALADIERELEGIERDAPSDLATIERRDRRRARRDTLWEVVKARIEGAPLPDESALVGPGRTLEGAFEASLRDADADADALLAQGDRFRRAADLRERIAPRRTELELARTRAEHAQRLWDDLWASSGFQPGSDPVSGIAWLEIRLEAQEHWADLELARRDEARARSILDDFTASVRSIREVPFLSFEDAQPAAQAAFERAKQLRQRRQDFERDNANIRENAQVARTRSEEQDALLATRASAWTDAWSAAFPGHPLPESPDAFLEGLRKIVDARIDLATQEDALLAAETERGEVSRSILPILESLGLFGGAERLGELLDRRAAALEVRSRRAQSEILRNGLEQRIVQRQDDLRRVEQQLEALWREAGVSDEPSFLAALAAHELATPLRIELDACRRKLDAASPDDLRIAKERSPTRWVEFLDESRRAAAEAGAERDRLLREKGALDNELDSLARRNDEPLERRAALRQDADKLNEEARAHLRNRMVRLVLQRACESFASRHTPPLQAWSGQYLSTITGGRWDSIDLAREDRLAIGSSVRGESLDETALSTGTADQVRLALRMAVARQWAASREPLPFLLDDVLVATDAERSARALAALRELSSDVQVIYFTCHASIAEAARAHGASIVGI